MYTMPLNDIDKDKILETIKSVYGEDVKAVFIELEVTDEILWA